MSVKVSCVDEKEPSKFTLFLNFFFLLSHRYDSIKLQRLQQKKLDRQEARMEKQMFVGKLQISAPRNEL